MFTVQLGLLAVAWALVWFRQRLSHGGRVAACLAVWRGCIAAAQVYLGPLSDSKVGMVLIVQMTMLLLPPGFSNPPSPQPSPRGRRGKMFSLWLNAVYIQSHLELDATKRGPIFNSTTRWPSK
ncbi:hypothetical protein [Methylomagnum sp.]